MKDKLQKILKNEKSTYNILIILFVIGIILFVINEYISIDQGKDESNDTFDEKSYITELEEKMTAIISKIDGVSDVNIIITLESSESYCFVSDKSNSFGDGFQNEIILKESKSGEKTPVISKVVSPEIKGVSIVCKGGANADIRLRITELVSSSLGIRKNRIYVTE